MVGRSLRHLLRSDVLHRSQEVARGGYSGEAGKPFGQPEVTQVDVPLRKVTSAVEQDVPWFDVAVHKLAAVRRIQGPGHLGEER